MTTLPATPTGGRLDDRARLLAVDELELVGRATEDRFDRVTRTVCRALQTPLGLLNLVTGDAVEVVSCTGDTLRRVERSVAPCSHVVQQASVLLVDDTTADARFAANPLVTGPAHVRAYAGVPLHGPAGQVVGTLCVLDVRARQWTPADVALLDDLSRWAEAELAQGQLERRRAAQALVVDRMKDEFVSVVSHELRTPLTSLQGALGLLSAGVAGALPPSGQRLADIAVSSTERLVRLVDGICELERLTAGQVVLRRHPRALSEVVRAAVDGVRPEAEGAGVQLRTTVEDATAWLDGERIAAVLGHLLTNAVHASERGAAVELRAGADDERVLFEVVDRGCGIAEQELDRVFGCFTRVDSSDSRTHGGTGLGLALARCVVDAHGGRLTARSSLGQGTTVTVALPQRSPTRPDGPAS